MTALFLLTVLPLSSAAPEAVSITPSKEGFEFRVGTILVAVYNSSPNVAKPFFWPLNAPGGVAVTRGWPMVKGLPKETTDHVHQKSAWFCHGDIIPEGLAIKEVIKHVDGVDFWSEVKGHGRIIPDPKEPAAIQDDTLVTKNIWTTSDGTVVLRETRTIRLVPREGAYLLMIAIDLHASEYNLTFGDTKEGSFGVRVSDQIAIATGKGTLTNASGQVGEKAVWGHPSAWCDYSGQVDGVEAGIAIFSSPQNPSPSVWHARGYGLMAANPFGRAKSGFPSQRGKTDLVKLAKGEHLRFDFAILTHTGNVTTGKVAEHYAAYLKLLNP